MTILLRKVVRSLGEYIFSEVKFKCYTCLGERFIHLYDMEGKEGMYRNNRNGYQAPMGNNYPSNGSNYNPNFQPPSSGLSNPSNNYRNTYGYQDFSNYPMNPNDFYGGYDRNSYIVEGNDYLGDDFNYQNNINNEYYYQNSSRYGNMQYGDNARQYQKNYYAPNGYGAQYDQMINNMSAGIRNGLTDEMSFDYTIPLYPEGGKKNKRRQTYANKPKRGGYDKGPKRYNVNRSYFEDDDDDSIMSMSDLFNLVVCVILALVLARLITLYVAQHTEVDGHSMNFNLKNEDILVIDKISYRFQDPQRFDIVIFPVKTGNFYVKRIIGLPGEKIKITNYQKESLGANEQPNTIYINGKPLEENYGFDNYLQWGTFNQEITLGNDEYFVMGDNRNDSKDSRIRDEVGNIKRSSLVGKAVFRVYPFNSFGFIDDTINKQIKIDKKYELGVDGKTKVNPNAQPGNNGPQNNNGQNNNQNANNQNANNQNNNQNNNNPNNNNPNNNLNNNQNNNNGQNFNDQQFLNP